MDKKVLLIADDDEMNRRIIHRFLSNDYNVLEACDGRETIEILEANHIDALLLDIIMPEIDGLAVLKIIKEKPKYNHLGILVATSTKEKTERTALSLGADDVVSKPYDPVVIKKRLNNIIKLKDLEKERESIRNDDFKLFEAQLIEKYAISLNEEATRLKHIASVIKNNKSNNKLVDQMCDDIVQEANNIKKISILK